ncbi:MAG: cupin domain-containing protein [bacterium]|nr:cupin domain-containing protein [bacterium]
MATLIERKNFSKPDEVRTFPKGRIEIVNVGGEAVARAIFEPGWKWSDCVKPQAGTGTCQSPHLGYVISGRMHVRGDDDTTMDYGPGDAMAIPPGHDAWVIGDETCVMFDVTAAPTYAKKR